MYYMAVTFYAAVSALYSGSRHKRFYETSISKIFHNKHTYLMFIGPCIIVVVEE